MMMRHQVALLALAACLATPAAWAGTACTAKGTDEQSFVKALDLAEKARTTLEASGAEVALIARVGQDLSEHGLRYSHLGYVWRDHPKGRWLVVHELNQCGSARSALFNEGLANFFMDDMFAYESLIVIPGAPMQKRLAAALASGASVSMHTPRYNMLSYAWSTAYQNSNQWVLEMYAASAGADVATRGDAQQWLKAAGYKPTTVKLAALTRLGARVLKANVAFDDHPIERRMLRKIDTVTVESVVDFVARHEGDVRSLTIR